MNTFYRDAVAKHGSYRKAAVATGIPRTTFFDRWKKELATEKFEKAVAAPSVVKFTKKDVKKYIFTCAVRNAPVHSDFLNNLIAYADHIGAELRIGPLTSTARQRFADLDPEEFDDDVYGFLSDEPVVIGDRVRFSPELNLTPTCVKPLEGLQAYTKRLWGVFPHTKISLETVATHKERETKVNVTTGAVTRAMYSPTKAGFRAKFDHIFGAVVVEVDERGQWIRHVQPRDDTDGTFYDLDNVVSGGKVATNTGVEALVYGDIHIEQLNPCVATATWKYNSRTPSFYKSLVDILKPKLQVFHDLMDFTSINYHEMGDFFKRYQKYITATDNLIEAFESAREFLDYVTTLAPTNIVVDSNHDYFLNKWLLKFDPAYTGDMQNAQMFYRLKCRALELLAEDKQFSLLGTALNELFSPIKRDCKFLGPDDSYEVMGVELGWHGHRGANGSRGSRGSFKFVTEKSTTAHLHGPSIMSGSHIVGTSSCLDLGYNQGPSSWSHTHGVLYPHGHRALLTMSDDRFWAGQLHGCY